LQWASTGERTLTMSIVQRPGTLIECGFPSKLDMISHLTNGPARALKKGVASCDMLRVGACCLRSGDARMGLPSTGDTCGTPDWEGELPERKHPSRGRKRN
jgi:hypothetical protein